MNVFDRLYPKDHTADCGCPVCGGAELYPWHGKYICEACAYAKLDNPLDVIAEAMGIQTIRAADLDRYR